MSEDFSENEQFTSQNHKLPLIIKVDALTSPNH